MELTLSHYVHGGMFN